MEVGETVRLVYPPTILTLYYRALSTDYTVATLDGTLVMYYIGYSTIVACECVRVLENCCLELWLRILSSTRACAVPCNIGTHECIATDVLYGFL